MITPENVSYTTVFNARVAFLESIGWEANRVRNYLVTPDSVTVVDLRGDRWKLETVNLKTVEWKKL